MIRHLPSVLVNPCCLLILAVARPVWADNGDPLAEIKDLRTADFLDSKMQATVRTWIGKQVEILLDEDAELSDKRGIRQVFNRAVGASPAATPDFKKKFTRATVEAFSEHLAEGEPTGVLMMVMILHDLRDLLPVSAFQKGGLLPALSHPLPAVKYWAARTIRLMHPSFGDLSGPRQAVIAALREAGVRETNGQALHEIYLALDFSKTVGQVGFADEVTQALVDVFEARGEGYATGRISVSDGEVAGLTAMSKLSGPMAEPGQAQLRKRYLTALGRMLCRIVDDYTGQLEMGSDRLDRNRKLLLRRLLLVTRGIEKELGRLVKAAGIKDNADHDLYGKMRGGLEAEILVERNKWCGWPPETKGVLNHKTLGVPIGAGYTEIKNRKPETKPASTQPKASSSG